MCENITKKWVKTPVKNGVFILDNVIFFLEDLY